MLKKSLYILLLVVGLGFLNISAQTDQIKSISKGVVNGSAISLPKPAYPPAALAVRASGAVNVQVTIDEEGNVIIANAVSGHPLLRASAVAAAQNAKFNRTLLSGVPVKVNGVIVYNFVPPTNENGESPAVRKEPTGVFVEESTADSDNSSPVLNQSAVVLPKPVYPMAAQAVRAGGAVKVKVVIDEEGNVESAEAVSGHPLLRAASVNAALLSKFRPTLIGGESVKVTGIVVYNFVAPDEDETENTPDETPTDAISGGVLNGKALSLPKPPYPAAARAVNASGAVNIEVLIDESGNVISAQAVSGHPLLREASEQAAMLARFSPTFVEENPVKVRGVIVFNFVP